MTVGREEQSHEGVYVAINFPFNNPEKDRMWVLIKPGPELDFPSKTISVTSLQKWLDV